MKKLTLIKNSLFVTFSVLLFVFSLILYIQSFENKMDSSSKVKFDEKYVVYIIVAICFLILTIYNFVMDYKKIKRNPVVAYGTICAATFVFSLYNLSCFFKALLDYWDSEYFVFKDNQMYLYLGISTLILFIGIVVKYFDDKGKDKE